MSKVSIFVISSYAERFSSLLGGGGPDSASVKRRKRATEAIALLEKLPTREGFWLKGIDVRGVVEEYGENLYGYDLDQWFFEVVDALELAIEDKTLCIFVKKEIFSPTTPAIPAEKSSLWKKVCSFFSNWVN
jgi:hypothetical protein